MNLTREGSLFHPEVDGALPQTSHLRDSEIHMKWGAATSLDITQYLASHPAEGVMLRSSAEISLSLIERVHETSSKALERINEIHRERLINEAIN